MQNLVENQEVEAIAICLLHSYRTPDHERQIRDIANQLYPNLYISMTYVYPSMAHILLYFGSGRDVAQPLNGACYLFLPIMH